MKIMKRQLDTFPITRSGEPYGARLREILAGAADVLVQGATPDKVVEAGELTDRLANGIGDIDLSAEDRALLKKNAVAVVPPFVYRQVRKILEPPKEEEEIKEVDLKVVNN